MEGDYDLALETYEDMYNVMDRLPAFFTLEIKCYFWGGLIKARDGKGTCQVKENVELLREFLADTEATAPRTR